MKKSNANLSVTPDRPVITAAMFHRAVGSAPVQDDLERCNCPRAGEALHTQCGWNWQKDKPVFMVGPES